MSRTRRRGRGSLAALVGVVLLATGCDVTVNIVAEPLSPPPGSDWEFAVHADDPSCLGGQSVVEVVVPAGGGTTPVTVTVPEDGSCDITIVELNHLNWVTEPGRIQRITVTETLEPIDVVFQSWRLLDVVAGAPTPTPQPSTTPAPTATPTPNVASTPSPDPTTEPSPSPTLQVTVETTPVAESGDIGVAPGIGFTG